MERHIPLSRPTEEPLAQVNTDASPPHRAGQVNESDKTFVFSRLGAKNKKGAKNEELRAGIRKKHQIKRRQKDSLFLERGVWRHIRKRRSFFNNRIQ